MRVLIGCESSGVVRRAFRARGHDAWSCDLQPADDGSPHHYQCDVLDLLRRTRRWWDMGIFHPECTYMTNSGVRWLHTRPERWALLDAAAAFFLELWNCGIPRVAIENPIMHGHATKRIGGLKPTQIIQPHMFGHPETKATGLYLRNLPKLVPTNDVREYMMTLPLKERSRIHYMPPGPDRWKKRSITFAGIAEAMATQWGALLESEAA